ncbi:MAG: hypothetical protein L0Y74_06355 [candidate division Zixibacteria bacterium]|nr:hypothetical protein [candidate division Zixibacteria bacterium]
MIAIGESVSAFLYVIESKTLYYFENKTQHEIHNEVFNLMKKLYFGPFNEEKLIAILSIKNDEDTQDYLVKCIKRNQFGMEMGNIPDDLMDEIEDAIEKYEFLEFDKRNDSQGRIT